MYAEDSFFNLAIAGRVGLAVLSLALVVLVLYVASRLYAYVRFGNRPLRMLARLAIALALFWLFEWLSPQLYYQYYILIFDGLPWQIVVKAPPGLGKLAELLSFTGKAGLSQHSRGLLGWALIALALLPRAWLSALK